MNISDAFRPAIVFEMTCPPCKVSIKYPLSKNYERVVLSIIA